MQTGSIAGEGQCASRRDAWRRDTRSVTRKINGKTYILIGNEQQLRAIGSGKKVIGRINKVTQTCTRQGLGKYQWVDDGTPSSEYAGDADLSNSDTLRDADASDHDSPLLCSTRLDVGRTRTKYYDVGAGGTQTDYSAANTGRYSQTPTT